MIRCSYAFSVNLHVYQFHICISVDIRDVIAKLTTEPYQTLKHLKHLFIFILYMAIIS